jgi:hypothetical protein
MVKIVFIERVVMYTRIPFFGKEFKYWKHYGRATFVKISKSMV